MCSIVRKAWLATALVSIAGPALGGGPHVVSVSATVRQVCRILGAPAFTFRSAEPTTGKTISAVPGIGVLSCTRGATLTIVSDSFASESLETDGFAQRPEALGAARCANRTYRCTRGTLTKIATGTGLGFGTGSAISFGVSAPEDLVDYANDGGGAVVLTVHP